MWDVCASVPLSLLGFPQPHTCFLTQTVLFFCGCKRGFPDRFWGLKPDLRGC
uniref:Uncharacterized protein n=1 Tax=Anguilla anguilla TaxID=7936 RepID=A0A0E9V2P6_ANGAN